MMARRLFVTGTDTGVGKTHVTLALVAGLRAAGARVAAMKPVASGCVRTPAGLRNADAERLRHACDPLAPYADVNPVALAEPVAPLIAARRGATAIAPEPILRAARRLAAGRDVLLIEGIGGWRVPLAPRLELSGLVSALGAEVVLVVGLRLGCINHALLSAEAIASSAPLVGWVANRVDPGYRESDETVALLDAMLPVPRLATLPWADPVPPALADRLAAALPAAAAGLRDPSPAG